MISILTAEAGDKHAAGFAVDEWLEALLRCRDEQRRRYAREVSPGLQMKVERYAVQRRAHTRRKAA